MNVHRQNYAERTFYYIYPLIQIILFPVSRELKHTNAYFQYITHSMLSLVVVENGKTHWIKLIKDRY